MGYKIYYKGNSTRNRFVQYDRKVHSKQNALNIMVIDKKMGAFKSDKAKFELRKCVKPRRRNLFNSAFRF